MEVPRLQRRVPSLPWYARVSSFSSEVIADLLGSPGQNLALYEGTSVLNAVTREFDLSFAPGYLENVKMCDFEQTPLYKGALTLSLAEPLRVKATRRKRT